MRVGIANRADYILSVAATSNVRLAAARGDSEEELVKYVSKLLPLGGKVKAYLGRDGKLVGSIDAKNLPATIELQGDFRTFAAESIVRLFGLTVGLPTGGGNAGKTMQTVGTLLEQSSLVSCVRNSMEPLSGNATPGQAASAGAGCFSTLVGLPACRTSPRRCGAELDRGDERTGCGDELSAAARTGTRPHAMPGWCRASAFSS